MAAEEEDEVPAPAPASNDGVCCCCVCCRRRGPGGGEKGMGARPVYSGMGAIGAMALASAPIRFPRLGPGRVCLAGLCNQISAAAGGAKRGEGGRRGWTHPGGVVARFVSLATPWACCEPNCRFRRARFVAALGCSLKKNQRWAEEGRGVRGNWPSTAEKRWSLCACLSVCP